MAIDEIPPPPYEANRGWQPDLFPLERISQATVATTNPTHSRQSGLRGRTKYQMLGCLSILFMVTLIALISWSVSVSTSAGPAHPASSLPTSSTNPVQYHSKFKREGQELVETMKGPGLLAFSVVMLATCLALSAFLCVMRTQDLLEGQLKPDRLRWDLEQEE
ncbi:hypothetical protein JX265_006118 [Neoarthrinium moseri]|uniref:Transmembrane protein n=1 Tax=Neoarthrinium moseri TaxID=1658444 RepID=A0A9Q0AR93_9PEZI|nr:uncharacterized protein JN550_004333 [Neoarthrinium moseri]KAI1871078.1 hypothetical protein JX265_006118 [Neoarthrinium moseri]KAI1872130.1 hypothetical protein JN550_004333 [Neoarthrinium moseri]